MEHLSLSELRLNWRASAEQGQGYGPRESAALARRALELGEPLLACDICAEGLAACAAAGGEAQDLQRAYGLALARSGALDGACKVAEDLIAAGASDEESIGLLARIHKDLWQRAIGTPEAAPHFERALALYQQAYANSRGVWSGVNAATLNLVGGNLEQARRIAGEVRQSCSAGPDDYWAGATLAECALILGELEEAKRLYRRISMNHGNFGNLASTRRNADLLLGARGLPGNTFDEVLPIPTVVTFSGHMLDRAGSPAPRFAEADVAAVDAKIRECLVQVNARIGYSSAANGGDILFIEALLDRGAEAHIVLPSAPDFFCRDSVDPATGWRQRFEALLPRVASVTVVSETGGTPLAYAYVNRVTLGLARVRARQVWGKVSALALWDGQGAALGGTGSAVRDWQAAGQSVACIAPRTLALSQAAPLPSGAMPAMAEGGQRIVSMLFADAVGFSKLADHQVSRFVERFLGAVADLIEQSTEKPLTRNTWGDGLYFCFENPGGAAELALRICEMTRAMDWQSAGLPADLNIRVALHAGPAYDCVNPVTKLRDFTGAHVSRAARIEPVTPAGQVYASQAFAALCECFQLSQYVCEYVGQLPLAKGYGTYPTFHVRRAAKQ